MLTFQAVLISLLLVEMYIRFAKEYVTPETLREKSLQHEEASFATCFPLKEQRINDKGSLDRVLSFPTLSREIAPNQILRRHLLKDPVFLTNNFTLPALTIAELYRCRWQVELFFKWIKQHCGSRPSMGPPKMRQNSTVDRRIGIHPRRDHQKAAQHQSQSLRNPTDFKCDRVRANALNSGTYGIQQQCKHARII